MDNKDKESKKKVLCTLFFSTLTLSTFTFGGGYVIVSLLKQKFVDKLHWIDNDEMLDLVAIAQSAPGAVAVNGAVVVGYKIAGISGAVVAILGAVIPPMIIITLISLCYDIFKNNMYVTATLEGMKAGVCAVIFSVVYDMLVEESKKRDVLNLIILLVAFVLNYFLKINVIYILLGTIFIGVLRTTVFKKRKG